MEPGFIESPPIVTLTEPFAGLSPLEQYLCGLDHSSTLRILDHLGPDIIILLSKTCKSLRRLTRHYSTSAWNIHTFLRNWFDCPEVFRRTMRISRAVVGGPAALQLFDRSHSTVSVFDVFIRFQGLLRMGRTLIEQGYAFCPARDDNSNWDIVALTLSGKLRFQLRETRVDDIFKSSVLRTFRFQRYKPGRKTLAQTVRLTLLRTDPVKWLLDSHSSARSEILLFDFRY